MKAKRLAYKEADDANKVGAFLNARMLNAVNATRWSDEQKARALRMKFALELVYSTEEVHLNHRKTKIVLKVTKPAKVVDRKQLGLLESQWEAQGVVKEETAQGFLYSFK